ncbi:MAG: hypothetical protein HYZ58_02710 [Acidobacteria bacterium]|nr:hypothetical protein [Acidobacteriota bacterium]MBI3262044.1 hypothetical protein [Acidobacteriota bacterium]
MRKRVDRCWLIAPLFLIALACDQAPLNSPVAPTPSGGNTPPSEAPATISGTVVTNSAASTILSRDAADLPTTVSVEGTNLSASIMPNGSFMLAGVPAGDVRLRFTGPRIDATLKLSGLQPGQVVTITVLVSGSSAVLQGSPHPGDTKVELEGLIEAIQPASRSFTLQGRTVRVTDTTEIRHGSRVLTFSDLHVGDRVHVRGTPESTIVVASRIELQNPGGPGPNPQPQPNEVKLHGVVSSLGGTCPSLTFNVGSQQIVTNGSTRFEHGSCADLRNGQAVEVEGVRQGDGSVLAREIEREEDEHEAEAEIEGAISALSGSCPTLSFLVAGKPVVTNSATRYDKTSCGELRNGLRVEVKGARQSNGSILATRVKREG